MRVYLFPRNKPKMVHHQNKWVKRYVEGFRPERFVYGPLPFHRVTGEYSHMGAHHAGPPRTKRGLLKDIDSSMREDAQFEPMVSSSEGQHLDSLIKRIGKTRERYDSLIGHHADKRLKRMKTRHRGEQLEFKFD